jgi:CheY-like chemotaxis protein
MGTAKDEEAATEIVRRLHSANPRQYFTFDQSTQAKHTIKSVPSPRQQVSVLVVDDADVIRRTITDFLNGEPAIKVLGEASNFAEAISMTAALKPDVILLDLHMSDDRSFNPAFVKAKLSGARVLAMSLSSDYESEEDIRLLAESFGAVTMLDKAKLGDALIPAILQTEA